MIYTDGVHLIADDINELHSFAQTIGLKLNWFQNHRIPHYDIWGSKLTKALRAGAKIITTKELINIVRKSNEHNRL